MFFDAETATIQILLPLCKNLYSHNCLTRSSVPVIIGASRAAMTPEQRLDRIERIAKLFVKEGRRYRRNLRALDEKIGILIDAQIRNEDLSFEIRKEMQALATAQALNEERFARFEERCAKSDERFARFEERFAKSDKRFATFERQTDQTLQALMLLMRERRNGTT